MNIIYIVSTLLLIYVGTFLFFYSLPANLDIDTKSEFAKIAYKFNTVLARKPRFADFYFVNFGIVVAVTVISACISPSLFGVDDILICVVLPVIFSMAQTAGVREGQEKYASGKFFMNYRMYVKFI
jgi:hypothetical protein